MRLSVLYMIILAILIYVIILDAVGITWDQIADVLEPTYAQIIDKIKGL